jgi:hypothetical protein
MRSKQMLAAMIILAGTISVACASGGAAVPVQTPVVRAESPAKSERSSVQPAARQVQQPVQYAASDEKLESSVNDEGGPGSVCSVSGCMAGQHPCGKAACMIPPAGGPAVCEYAPKLTGACRCWPGDARPCALSGGGTGWKTCVAHPTALETYWTACAP